MLFSPPPPPKPTCHCQLPTNLPYHHHHCRDRAPGAMPSARPDAEEEYSTAPGHTAMVNRRNRCAFPHLFQCAHWQRLTASSSLTLPRAHTTCCCQWPLCHRLPGGERARGMCCPARWHVPQPPSSWCGIMLLCCWSKQLHGSIHWQLVGVRRGVKQPRLGPEFLKSSEVPVAQLRYGAVTHILCQETTWLVHRCVVAVTSNCMYRPWNA